MNKNSELDCFLYYMWNEWSLGVCQTICPNSYDPVYGSHLWRVWVNARNKCNGSPVGAAAQFYADLDSDTRRKIVDAAVHHYNH